MLVMPTSDRYWPPTCRALGRAEWISDPRYGSLAQRAAQTLQLTAAIAALIGAQPLDHWRARFDAEALTWAPVAELPRGDRRPADDRDGGLGGG